MAVHTTILNGVAVPVMMTVTVNFAAGNRLAAARRLGERAVLERQRHHHNRVAGQLANTVRIGGEIREPKNIRDVRPVYPQER